MMNSDLSIFTQNIYKCWNATYYTKLKSNIKYITWNTHNPNVIYLNKCNNKIILEQAWEEMNEGGSLM